MMMVFVVNFVVVFDVELMWFNDDYEVKCKGGGFVVFEVWLVVVGMFEYWLCLKGKWGG